ncbi:hypothetical protein NJ7G_2299 [Natrinema sp. J7-2]|nr:hypothetical protein [Natrinema sp. J7-2]AFO57534.1 hypothetical protein NJ7G_2299 [Natrinema sp. J7-2]
MFEPVGHFVYEVFLYDSSEKGVGHLPNNDILVALLVELAFQFVLQPGIEVLGRRMSSGSEVTGTPSQIP